MAKNNASAVSVGKPKAEGAVFIAPAGTAAPTDAVTALAPTFKCLGYVSEDGLTNAVKAESESFVAWGGDVVLSAPKGYEESFEFALLQNDEEVFKFIYGENNVSGTIAENNLKILHNAKPGGRFVMVFEVLLTGGYVKRIVLPVAEITERSDVEYKHDSLIEYKIKVSTYPDENGNNVTEYIGKVK